MQRAAQVVSCTATQGHGSRQSAGSFQSKRVEKVIMGSDCAAGRGATPSEVVWVLAPVIAIICAMAFFGARRFGLIGGRPAAAPQAVQKLLAPASRGLPHDAHGAVSGFGGPRHMALRGALRAARSARVTPHLSAFHVLVPESSGSVCAPHDGADDRLA